MAINNPRLTVAGVICSVLPLWQILCGTVYQPACSGRPRPFVCLLASLLSLMAHSCNYIVNTGCPRYFYQSTVFWLLSTDLYRNCAALASFSGTFDLFLFEAVNFEFIVEKGWFCLIWTKTQNKWSLFCFDWVWFGLSDWILFGLVCLFRRQTKKLNKRLISINLICDFVFGYSKDKQKN